MFYSVVDMNLDGGLGGVVATEKNVSLLEHCSEKIAAIIKAYTTI